MTHWEVTIRLVLKKILHSRACKIDKDMYCKAHDEARSQLPWDPANVTKRPSVRADGKCAGKWLVLFRSHSLVRHWHPFIILSRVNHNHICYNVHYRAHTPSLVLH